MREGTDQCFRSRSTSRSDDASGSSWNVDPMPLMTGCGRLLPGARPSPASQSVLRIRVRPCILLRFDALQSEGPLLDRAGRAPAPRISGSSRRFRGYESASSSITLPLMDQNLCRRLMPRPKFGCSRPTTAAAAPATFRIVHRQVVGREQMAIAADTGYGHGVEDTFRRKRHNMTFGCIKSHPRYQF